MFENIYINIIVDLIVYFFLHQKVCKTEFERPKHFEMFDRFVKAQKKTYLQKKILLFGIRSAILRFFFWFVY